MRIELVNLEHGRGDFAHVYQPDELGKFDERVAIVEPVAVAGKVRRAGAEVFVNGHIETSAQVECDRCLNKVELPVSAYFDLQYITGAEYESSAAAELTEDAMSVSVFDGEALDEVLAQVLHSQCPVRVGEAKIQVLTIDDCSRTAFQVVGDEREHPFATHTGMAIMAPRKDGDYLFAGSVFGNAVGLKLAADKPAVAEAWRGPKNMKGSGMFPTNMTPFAEGGVVYGVDQPGEFRAIKIATGERLWQSWLPLTGEDESRPEPEPVSVPLPARRRRPGRATIAAIALYAIGTLSLLAFFTYLGVW